MKKTLKFLATLLSTITLILSASVVDAMDNGNSSKSKNSDELTEKMMVDPNLLKYFVELEKQISIELKKVTIYRLIVESLRLAYTDCRCRSSVNRYILENRETVHITRHTLEALRDSNIIEEFNSDVRILQNVATRYPHTLEGVVHPADETSDQLYALAVFSDTYVSMRLGAGNVAIPRDYLIRILSIARQEKPQPDEFYVNNVEISYMNGRMKITCRNGEEITYEAVIGEYYK